MRDKEIELKMLENLQPRKFNKDYVEKFVTLLHDSKILKPKYAIQRKKLKLNPIKIINKDNIKNNNKKGIYITSATLDNNNQYPNINMFDNNEEYAHNLSDYEFDDEQLLTYSEKDILYNKNDNNDNNDNNDSNDNNEEINEEKGKLLYEILRTKNKFNRKNKYDKLYSSTEINELPEINNNIINYYIKRKKYFTPNFIKNFDNSLAKSIEKKNVKKLTDNQVKNLYYISKLKVFDSVDKMRNKSKILNKFKNYNQRYLSNRDLFKYDKKKWDEKRKELNKNINEIMFNKFNLDNKKYLKHMRKSVDKLHENANYIETDLGKLFNNLNDFIDKNREYIKENNHSNKESSKHSKRTSFIKKQSLNLKNPNPLLSQPSV